MTLRVAFDAYSVRTGTTAIVLENLLRGWVAASTGDDLVVLAGADPQFTAPSGVRVVTARPPLPGAAGGLWQRSFGLRRAVRAERADVLVSLVTASAFAGVPVPRAAVVYDLRHELRPHQFGRGRRLARRLGYAWTFRTADALCCISRRTYDDLVRRRPRLRDKAVVTALGSEHALSWSRVPAVAGGAGPAGEQPYALAFGHFANKNADRVLDAWAEFCRTDDRLVLRLVGMSRADRAAAQERVRDLGIADRVQLMPWLDDEQFAAGFAAARLVLFPSDFEGFGLPAVEAMALGIPVVVSGDPALAEVTGGLACIAADVSPRALAATIGAALDTDPDRLATAQARAATFSWQTMAGEVRAAVTRPR